MPVGLRERKVKEEDPVEEFMDVDGECICFMVRSQLGLTGTFVRSTVLSCCRASCADCRAQGKGGDAEPQYKST